MRTAKATLKIQNAGALLGSAFDTLNLISGVSAVDSGSGVAGVTGTAAAGANLATDAVTPVTSGANITLDLTTLSHTFVAIEVVFRNGQALSAASWSRTGNTITVFNADSTEQFMVQYTY